jgi:hypothetical protein
MAGSPKSIIDAFRRKKKFRRLNRFQCFSRWGSRRAFSVGHTFFNDIFLLWINSIFLQHFNWLCNQKKYVPTNLRVRFKQIFLAVIFEEMNDFLPLVLCGQNIIRTLRRSLGNTMKKARCPRASRLFHCGWPAGVWH